MYLARDLARWSSPSFWAEEWKDSRSESCCMASVKSPVEKQRGKRRKERVSSCTYGRREGGREGGKEGGRVRRCSALVK